MGKSSQRKGREGELELVQILHSYGFEDVRPGKPISYGEEPDVVGLPGVHIECKRVERLNVPEAMQQAERDSQRFQDGIPVLFHRRNRQTALYPSPQDHRVRSGKRKNQTQVKKNGDVRPSAARWDILRL